MELSNIIKYIAKQQGIESVNFMSDVHLVDNGEGPFIEKWNLPIDKPTEDELIVAEGLAQAEADSLAYIALREAEYPTWQEQADMRYWDLKNGTSVWFDTIEAIKAKYPKP